MLSSCNVALWGNYANPSQLWNVQRERSARHNFTKNNNNNKDKRGKLHLDRET